MKIEIRLGVPIDRLGNECVSTLQTIEMYQHQIVLSLDTEKFIHMLNVYPEIFCAYRNKPGYEAQIINRLKDELAQLLVNNVFNTPTIMRWPPTIKEGE